MVRGEIGITKLLTMFGPNKHLRVLLDIMFRLLLQTFCISISYSLSKISSTSFFSCWYSKLLSVLIESECESEY